MARVPKKTTPVKKPIEGYDQKRKKRLHSAVAASLSRSPSVEALRRLSAHLSISDQDMARLLRVPTGMVVDWESGQTVVPSEIEVAVKAADTALVRMLKIFRPEQLPNVVRTQVELFQGRSALDLILEGRIEEVADLYNAAFAYQG